ncbi:MAG: HAD hydrolase-like protein [Bacteroidota bacterium]|nr:HAD hydrolase-like protein [Bacteroidota bacterium]
MQKEVKHIIWDWNGTLLNDVWLCLECINILLKQRSLPQLTLSSYHKLFSFPVRKYYTEAGFDFKKESFEIPARQFIDLYNARRTECSLNTNALDTLKFFHKKGVRQYILSASESWVLKEMMEFYHLDSYMDAVYGLDNHYADGKTGLGKQMLLDLNIEPESAILIGDTCHDQEVAFQLGILAVLFTGGHYSKDRLTSCNTCLADSLSELPSLIHTLKA